ncbi:hypothetical protein N7540_003419 [Penicillium herquei]|nr:hypothetical protein N7540_003419 [Penicillium herquei]
MAYTDDAVKAKLSALNETQESIVTVAQWVMFHRRHADRTAQIWLQKVRDAPPLKRLNLIIAEATATAYKGSSNDVQQKLRRVVEVWRQRNVFEGPILDAVDARPLGGSLFRDSSSGSTPSELQPLVPLQVAVNKATITANSSSARATSEYDKMHDTKEPQPAPPVRAARLSQLRKSLVAAESVMAELIKSRQDMIDGLEKILGMHRSEKAKEISVAERLTEKRTQTDIEKREVEDAIMQNMTEDHSASHEFAEGGEFDRPEAEALTPPPMESFTPVVSPKPDPQPQQKTSHGPFTDDQEEPIPQGLVIPDITQPDNGLAFPDDLSPGGGNDFDFGANGSKRRKVAHGEEDYAQYAAGDLDADVAALIASQAKQ